MTTELMIPEKLDVVAIFAPDGSKDILESIEREARSVELDISTAEGRKAVASLAYKISRSKSFLDEQGESLVRGWKESAKAVDVERKRIRDRMDALRDEIRKPLTDFENKEKDRIAGHEEAMRLLGVPMLTISRSDKPEVIEAFTNQHNSYFDSRQWDEFSDRATKKHNEVVSFLDLMLRESNDRIIKETELRRLQKEESDRLQRERDERLQSEAAERARLEAEHRAEAERDKAAQSLRMESLKREQAEKAARDAEERERQVKEKARQDAAKASEKARKDKEDAVKKERERVERERLAAEATAQRKRDDEVNRNRVHKDIVSDLEKHTYTVLVGETRPNVILKAILDGMIRHVFIKYD